MPVTTRCSHPIELFRRHQVQFGRHYALESTHCDVLCSHSMTSAVHDGSLQWAVEERVSLCSDVWYCQLPSFLKRNKLAGMFALQPLSRDNSWHLLGMHYAIRRPFSLFPLSIGIELFWRTHCNTWESTPSWLLSKSNNRRSSSFIKDICQLDNAMAIHWYHWNIRRYCVNLWKLWWWWWRWDQ